MSLTNEERATIARLDAMTVGLAVLQAILNLRRNEASQVDLPDHGVTLRVISDPGAGRVLVFEV